MSSKRRHFVGCFVGSVVGKIRQPDKELFIGINGLGLNCRECRVFTTGESSGEIGNPSVKLQVRSQNPVNLLIRLDLNDAGD